MPRYLDTSIDSEYLSGFLFPSISTILPGYDFTYPDPVKRIIERIVEPDCAVKFGYKVFFDGKCEHESSRVVQFREFLPVNWEYEPFVWPDMGDQWKGGAGYFEFEVEEVDRRQVFRPRFPLSIYAIYSKSGKKSFLSDSAFKYGVPRVIDMVARFGKFVDGHPLIHIDRERDLGETIVLINPYQRPLVSERLGHDGHKFKKTRIDPHSARQFRLVDMLEEGEADWAGQIQVTANNRVVAFNVKHSLADPTVISDHEHLDPFRADPTGIPVSQLARQKIDGMLGMH